MYNYWCKWYTYIHPTYYHSPVHHYWCIHGIFQHCALLIVYLAYSAPCTISGVNGFSTVHYYWCIWSISALCTVSGVHGVFQHCSLLVGYKCCTVIGVSGRALCTVSGVHGVFQHCALLVGYTALIIGVSGRALCTVSGVWCISTLCTISGIHCTIIGVSGRAGDPSVVRTSQ